MHGISLNDCQKNRHDLSHSYEPRQWRFTPQIIFPYTVVLDIQLSGLSHKNPGLNKGQLTVTFCLTPMFENFFMPAGYRKILI